MFRDLWFATQRVATTYVDLLNHWWSDVGPEEYAMLLILVAVVGWWLMKNVH